MYITDVKMAAFRALKKKDCEKIINPKSELPYIQKYKKT